MKKPKIKTVLKIFSTIILLIVFLLYIAAPFAAALSVVIPVNKKVSEIPEGFENVQFETEDKVKISAWYKNPKDDTVVILAHGAGNNKSNMQKYFDFLINEGYGILAIDLRGHGQSTGQTNKFAWNGTKDISAAVKFLKDKDIKNIYGFGSSLGGEVLIGAASKNPEITKIISDGATARSLEEYTTLPENKSLIRNFFSRSVYFWVGIFSGDNPPKPMVDSIKSSPNTTFMFITSGNEKAELDYAKIFKDASPNSKVWTIENVDHTGGFDKNPEEYKNNVVEFFGK